MEKLAWCGYANVRNFEDFITCLDTIHECDGQTDRRSDGQMDRHRTMARAELFHSIARQKHDASVAV